MGSRPGSRPPLSQPSTPRHAALADWYGLRWSPRLPRRSGHEPSTPPPIPPHPEPAEADTEQPSRWLVWDKIVNRGAPPADMPRYEDVKRRFNNPDVMSFFNDHASPRLVMREAALEFLSTHLAYRLFPGTGIKLHITEDCRHAPVHTYAHHYMTTDAKTGEQGCVVFRLQPSWVEKLGKKRVIILFRGTAHNGKVTGMRTNFDLPGVGYSAFQEVQGEVMRWIHDALREGCDVDLVGHSQGGAYAFMALGALPKALQQRVSVYSRNGPKTTHAVNACIVPNQQNIVFDSDWWDPTRLAGDVVPEGARYLFTHVPLRDAWWCHGRPRLAEQQLNGEPLTFDVFDTWRAPWYEHLLPIEVSRRCLGRFAARLFRP